MIYIQPPNYIMAYIRLVVVSFPLIVFAGDFND
jgi:hypothetical protein